MMGGMNCGMMGGAMLLTGLLFLGLLAVGIWLIVRAATGSTSGGRSGERSSALAILEERYARGEVDDEEFHRRRRLLQSSE
jgi:putative membrane protein